MTLPPRPINLSTDASPAPSAPRVLRSACRSRTDLMIENAALWHQLCVLTRARRRPRMTAADRWFWVVLHRLWRRWSEVLVLVKPETVVRWRRAGFRLYWNWLS